MILEELLHVDTWLRVIVRHMVVYLVPGGRLHRGDGALPLGGIGRGGARVLRAIIFPTLALRALLTARALTLGRRIVAVQHIACITWG